MRPSCVGAYEGIFGRTGRMKGLGFSVSVSGCCIFCSYHFLFHYPYITLSNPYILKIEALVLFGGAWKGGPTNPGPWIPKPKTGFVF